MKKSLGILLVLAIFSHAHCTNLGRILGIKRNWESPSSRSSDPEIIEIVRWRQPVCVVPGKNVAPCVDGLRKFQNDYEKNSGKGIESNESKKQADVLTPQIVDSFKYESVDSIKLDSSEETGRSLDQTVTMNLRSSTPSIENAPNHRQGKYLVMSNFGKVSTIVHKAPPAIYVTKVLNSPVTATLVANNCFPDIGVPLCENYQEEITIYKNPTSFAEKTGTSENTAASASLTTEDKVQENTESSDFWSDPNNPHFDDGTSQNEPARPTGLLEQAIQHVISKPGVINAIPPGVIDAIANNPQILEAVANAGNNGESSGSVTETSIKPQISGNFDVSQEIVTSSTPKPGFIGSFLDIQRPAILNNFFTSGFNIFNRSTTPKPLTTLSDVEQTSPTNLQSSANFGNGLLGQGIAQAPFIGAIQDLIYRPETVNTNEKPEFKPILIVEPTKRPGIFENLWNPGSFGIFNRQSTSKPDLVVDQKVLDESKTVRPDYVEVPERPQLSEIFVKPENDISGRPTLPNIFGSAIVDEEQHEAKPTQAPGIFGGIFKNPVRPVDESVEKTKTILGMGSIFSRPKNKPLIIERPGAKPLLVEQPIYVEEKPVESAGFFNFFVPASNKPLLNVDHEVIKEPVYVYQKPQTSSGILSNVFGNGSNLPQFFQGWAIFGNSGAKKEDPKQPIDEIEKVSQPSQNLRSTVVQPVDESSIAEVPQDIPEAVPVKSTPLETPDVSPESEENESAIDDEAIEELVEELEREEIEDASTPEVDENDSESEVIPKTLLSDETAPVNADPLEKPVEPLQLDSSAKSSTFLEELPEDIAKKVNAELDGPIEVVETSLKTVAEKLPVETSESSAAETEVAHEKVEDSIAVTAEKNLVPESENVVVKEDDTDEEVENDA